MPNHPPRIRLAQGGPASSGGILLAGFGPVTGLPDGGAVAETAPRPVTAGRASDAVVRDLAVYRSAAASARVHAAASPSFAVDVVAPPAVRTGEWADEGADDQGSGRRSSGRRSSGDPGAHCRPADEWGTDERGPYEWGPNEWSSAPTEDAAPGREAADGTGGDGHDRGRGAAGRARIAVDLRAECQVRAVTLVFEAGGAEQTSLPAGRAPHRSGRQGSGSSLPGATVAFRVETSLDGSRWRTVRGTSRGRAGTVRITLEEPTAARWVRLTAQHRAGCGPLGLGGLRVYGTCDRRRPPAVGWTAWENGHRGAAPALRADADGGVPIGSGWDLVLDDWAGTADGGALSGPGADGADWPPAGLPGGMPGPGGPRHAPLSGTPDPDEPASGDGAWWYRQRFALPQELRTGPGRRVWLEFEGLDHEAEVWFDGARAGVVRPGFARAAFDVTDAVRVEPGAGHVLAVRIVPRLHRGGPDDAGSEAGSSAHLGLLHPDTLVSPSVSGRDGMPAAPAAGAGLWSRARLRSTGSVVLGDPRVVTDLPDLPDRSTAELTITVPVRNADPVPRTVTVWASFGSVSVSATGTVPADATADFVLTPADHPQLRLHQPALWWPNGYGQPVLHDLWLTAAVCGTPSDRKAVRFGIRRFDYSGDLRAGDGPVPLGIAVNGVPVFCRGADWSEDGPSRRMPPGQWDTIVAMHRDMNFTMIRNRAGSRTRDEFYSACDEHGILVWNDVPATGPCADGSPGPADIVRETVLRGRIHPSVAVWCSAGAAPGETASVQRAVADLDDDVLFLSGSAAVRRSGGEPCPWIDPAGRLNGGAGARDADESGLHAGIGFPALAVGGGAPAQGDRGSGLSAGARWSGHSRPVDGDRLPATYLRAINDRLNTSGSREEFCRKAQFVDYESARAVFEAWNAHLAQDAGALPVGPSHPARLGGFRLGGVRHSGVRHSGVRLSPDGGLDTDGGYYGARKGCEPLHVQADPSNGTVLVANHTAAAVPGATVTAQLHDLGGRPIGAALTRRIDVPAAATADAFTVPFDRSLPATHLLRLRLTASDGRLLSGNDYWRYRTATDMRSLNGLPSVRLSLHTRPAGPDGVTATVGNTGTAPAAMVRLSLRDARCGERLLPALADDNYFWLLPGESRDVTLSWAYGLGGGAKEPYTVAEAYNALRVGGQVS